MRRILSAGCVFLAACGGTCWYLLLAAEPLPIPSNSAEANGALPHKRPDAESILEQKVTIQYERQSLGVVLSKLARQFDVALVMDASVTSDLQNRLTEKVELEVTDVPLGTALQQLLAPHGFVCMPDGQTLRIASAADAGGRLLMRVYDVADLVKDDSQFFDLIEVITSICHPDTWDEVGGDGAVRQISEVKGLAVLQTPVVHADLERLFSNLRWATQPPAEGRTCRDFAENTELDRDESLRIRLRNTRCGMELTELSVRTALEKLAREHQFKIAFDAEALKEAGSLEDEPVSQTVAQASLRTALTLLIEPLKLVWYVENQTVHVATAAEAEEKSFHRAYDVRDLLASPDDRLIWPIPRIGGGIGGGGSSADLPADPSKQPESPPRVLQQELGQGGAGLPAPAHNSPKLPHPFRGRDMTEMIESIESLICPDSWDSVGGPGSIRTFDESVLVVRQRQLAHDALEDLFDRLRELARKRNREAALVPKSDPDELKFVVYRIDQDSPETIARLITEVVEPQSWQSAGGRASIHATSNSIVIWQTRSAHFEVVKLLHHLFQY